jgi:hypothetical protein
MMQIEAAIAAVRAAFSLTKLLAVLGAGLALVGAYGVWHHEVYQSGYHAAIADIAAADEKAVGRALKLRGELQLCQASSRAWDQSTGKCR